MRTARVHSPDGSESSIEADVVPSRIFARPMFSVATRNRVSRYARSACSTPSHRSSNGERFQRSHARHTTHRRPRFASNAMRWPMGNASRASFRPSGLVQKVQVENIGVGEFAAHYVRATAGVIPRSAMLPPEAFLLFRAAADGGSNRDDGGCRAGHCGRDLRSSTCLGVGGLGFGGAFRRGRPGLLHGALDLPGSAARHFFDCLFLPRRHCGLQSLGWVRDCILLRRCAVSQTRSGRHDPQSRLCSAHDEDGSSHRR